VSLADAGEILRAPLLHTPRNPFRQTGALERYSDGALFHRDGKIAACGDYSEIRAAHANAAYRDLRGGFLLPGLIDTHVHFPQLRVIGSLGQDLMGWLEQFALPEEARMAELSYASDTADRFLHALASHGTTTAMMFGAHFASATAILFEAADAAGLRILSGFVLSDRGLLPELHHTPQTAYRDACELIRRFHRKGRSLYAVTPRFAISTSEAMLEVCRTLMQEVEGLRFQTHLNENRGEIEMVRRLFPWAEDYLAVYERYGLTGRGAVMAHNVHPRPAELERLAAEGTAVAHCPCSNAVLGSGILPLWRHIEAGVHCSLGTDVGAGTGFGMLKEGLQAYMLQRLAQSPRESPLDAAQLLYLATRAGAEAIHLEDEVGDFTPGKSADFVYLRAPASSPLEAVIERAENMERILGALFTLGDSSCVREVRVGGVAVYCAKSDDD